MVWEGSSLELSPGKLDTDLLSKRSPENRAAISIVSARPPIITVIGASPCVTFIRKPALFERHLTLGGRLSASMMLHLH